MTYCTRCWCLGHMRDKRELQHPRCRICLDNLTERQTHECSNIVHCAQCDGLHHSLSSERGKVVQYRSDLKEQVNNALSTGKLHRLVPQECVQPMEFQMKQNEYPSLPPLITRAAPWNLVSTQSLTTNNTNRSEDSTKMLISINQNILDMKENTYRMNDQVNQTVLDTELHHETLVKLIPTVVSLIGEFIWPIIPSNTAGLKSKQPQLQKMFNDMEALLLYLKSEYTARRKRSTSSAPCLSPSQPFKATETFRTLKLIKI